MFNLIVGLPAITIAALGLFLVFIGMGLLTIGKYLFMVVEK